jgi:hypothetical protein
MSKLFKSLIALLGLVLIGCSSGVQTTTVSLPISTTQPTFMFFYTDN